MKKSVRRGAAPSISVTPCFGVSQLVALSIGIFSIQSATGTENVPHAPFAQWAEVPAKGQIIAGLFYDESESYHIWAKNSYHNISVKADGETYGIDINQGYLALQYGITERWAVDAAVGYTTSGWRFFSPNFQPQSTSGFMDFAFGVRYQIFKEDESVSPWQPTLTFRAGAVLPGTYAQDFPFAPGTRSTAVEPEILIRKHFGWPGLGVYGDGLFRWNRTTHNDQYIVSTGLFQQIKGWELNVGYRHLGTITGEDIVLNPDRSIFYPRMLRENSDSSEAGFSYTTSKRQIQYGFYTRSVWGGSNTDGKFWFGGYVNVPFGGK
ncbi:hypothetical protein [Pedosphaera parvula]|uniref:Uncharacterized protein n=1 Tax=Pedosphaera parvula (strain Ellin514) TaxID=320771 RepID=B9XB10_PEDPL|nr:hypothetical protein [Pedosphaera parvula]EEF63195.1 hypothetical protein Cflav_PD5830 [Pedosphaera parvula Ellin514]